MFKNLKIGMCVLAFSMFAFASTSFSETWPTFHNGNTLIKGKLRVTDQIVFTGGRTVMSTLLPADIIDGALTSPNRTITVGSTGNAWQSLQVDADGGSTGDDHIMFAWAVPDGYVADSGRMNIFWSCESAETALDTVTFDMTVLSITDSETVDAAPTAFTAVEDITWSGEADKVQITQLNFEVTTIAIDDNVYFDLWVDESASMFTDTVDIHAIKMEWESTE